MKNLPLALLGCAALGCGGAAPLLHPAHVLRPGVWSVAAGVSGETVLLGESTLPAGVAGSASAAAPGEAVGSDAIERLTVAPGVAPWLSGRVGIEGSNEAGLTYTGRAVRLDGRHAFSLGEPTLSVGLGASAVYARRWDQGADPSALYGGGLDVPVLVGLQSTGDLYAVWFGPRFGIELLGGEVQMRGDRDVAEASGRHLELGLVLGVRGGFRHVHAALEASASYHHVKGTLGGSPVTIGQGVIAPGGALTVTF